MTELRHFSSLFFLNIASLEAVTLEVFGLFTKLVKTDGEDGEVEDVEDVEDGEVEDAAPDTVGGSATLEEPTPIYLT